jgi:hypothetical protein
VLALPGRLDAVRALVERAISDARLAGRPDALGIWLPGRHPYAQVLRGLGFIDLRRRLQFTYFNRLGDAPQFAALRDPRARVHLTIGDSDLI